MKSASLGICVLMVMCAGTSAKAQCSCGASYAAPVSYASPAPVRSYYSAPAAPRMSTPSMSTSLSPSSVAYVNKLATPVPRANYSLNYAVHLTDGRILLSDFLPPGHTVRGIESQSGAGGRRLTTSSQAGGAIAVIDPSTNANVATFAPPSSY